MASHSTPPTSAARFGVRRQGGIRLFALFGAWTARSRARRDLARLDDHMLADIGLDRAAAASEATRRFWQD